jgi:hypothetical protein
MILVRKEGVEPSRELPHRNLNRDVGEVSSGKDVDSVRQETSENAEGRQLSGRTGPVLEMLEEAREGWATGRSPSALRRRLLEILQQLEADDDR